VVRIGFEREDWTAFRTVDGLQRRAGTSQDKLVAVVIKELVDNALGEAGDCELSLNEGAIVVEDRGRGIEGDDETIARIFSMDRSQISSKYLRLPTRGALGNGLRVVVGAVAATGGKLIVSTQGRILELIPYPKTGQSDVVCRGKYSEPGTRIEVTLGSQLTPDDYDLWMGELAIVAARHRERTYTGKTSPHWYDLDAFHELVMSVQDAAMTVRKFVSSFDGCSRLAGEIAEQYSGMPVRSLDRDQASALLRSLQEAASEVNPDRLGCTAEDAFPGEYAREKASVQFPPRVDGSRITIPIVVEAWAETDQESADSDATIMINGSPCIAEMFASHEAKEKCTLVWGCGLAFRIKTGAKKCLFHVNVITPYMPITSDGKAPHLGAFQRWIEAAMEKAWKRVKKRQPREEKVDLKAVVFEHMEDQIVAVSTNRRYRFNWRQVYYRLRPIVWSKVGKSAPRHGAGMS
jgi:hypothetical protein